MYLVRPAAVKAAVPSVLPSSRASRQWPHHFDRALLRSRCSRRSVGVAMPDPVYLGDCDTEAGCCLAVVGLGCEQGGNVWVAGAVGRGVPPLTRCGALRPATGCGAFARHRAGCGSASLVEGLIGQDGVAGQLKLTAVLGWGELVCLAGMDGKVGAPTPAGQTAQQPLVIDRLYPGAKLGQSVFTGCTLLLAGGLVWRCWRCRIACARGEPATVSSPSGRRSRRRTGRRSRCNRWCRSR